MAEQITITQHLKQLGFDVPGVDIGDTFHAVLTALAQTRAERDAAVKELAEFKADVPVDWKRTAESAQQAHAEILRKYKALRDGIRAALDDGKTPEQRLQDAIDSGESADVQAARAHFALIDTLWKLLRPEAPT